jgi:hypothetical protein
MSLPVILPTPLPSGSISLGQLITDPLQSHIASFAPLTKPSNQRTSHSENYRRTIVHDKCGHFISCADAADHASKDNLLYLTAEQSSHIFLVQSKTTFNTLCKNLTARSFLHNSNLQGQSLYYVTGIQTLKNPSFERDQDNVAEGSGSKIRLPSHVRRMDSAIGLDNTNVSTENIEESVFAVELLKVKCLVGSASEPHSVDDVDYEWTYHALEADDEDVQLAIGLGKAVRVEELRRLKGVVDDDGYDGQSWSYGSDDEEGLGGF